MSTAILNAIHKLHVAWCVTIDQSLRLSRFVLGSPHAKASGRWGARLCVCCCPAVRPQVRGFGLDVLALRDVPGGCILVESSPTMWAGYSDVLDRWRWCPHGPCAKWHCAGLHASLGFVDCVKTSLQLQLLHAGIICSCRCCLSEVCSSAVSRLVQHLGHSCSAWALTSTACTAICELRRAAGWGLPEDQKPPRHQAAAPRPRVAAETNTAGNADPCTLVAQ